MNQFVIPAIVLAISFSATTCLAQNPLRPESDSFTRFGSRPNARLNYQPDRIQEPAKSATSQVERPSFESEIFVDHQVRTATPQSINVPTNQFQVQQTNFNQVPNSVNTREKSNPVGMTSLNASVDQSWQDPQRILNLVMKLSLNLVFVLSFAFGLLLIAKKWLKPKPNETASERAKGDSLNIVQTLNIDPKISLKLVQWRKNRFLIACDQNGIQSVSPLNSSFEQTLQELDEDEQSDDKILKKLLSNLELKAA